MSSGYWGWLGSETLRFLSDKAKRFPSQAKAFISNWVEFVKSPDCEDVVGFGCAFIAFAMAIKTGTLFIFVNEAPSLFDILSVPTSALLAYLFMTHACYRRGVD